MTEIRRDGESRAAWDVYVLAGRLEAVRELAVREGLLGFAVLVSRARRLLDAAVDLYAFAGRGDEVTDALIDAAEGRALVAAMATDVYRDTE